MEVIKTKEGTIFSIDDLIDNTPKCEEEGFLKGIAIKNNENYCVKKQVLGDSCPYLKIDNGYTRCSYYDK